MCAFVMSFGVFCMMKARLLYGENGMKTRLNMSFCGILRQKICTLSLADVYLLSCQGITFAHDLCGFYGQMFLR